MQPKSKGYFITLEGGEGVGKSTQSKILAEAFERKGFSVIQTREPGGTPQAEKIRDLVLKSDAGSFDTLTEALLMLAARHEHICRKIQPALTQGQVVICDRFSDSTLVYQGYAGGIDLQKLQQLMTLINGVVTPDLTLLFDMPIELSLGRMKSRGEELDQFEGRTKVFHEKLRAGFLDLSEKEPKRIAVIQATGTVDEIATDVRAAVQARLGVGL